MPDLIRTRRFERWIPAFAGMTTEIANKKIYLIPLLAAGVGFNPWSS
jgi:hypothetical protein